MTDEQDDTTPKAQGHHAANFVAVAWEDNRGVRYFVDTLFNPVTGVLLRWDKKAGAWVTDLVSTGLEVGDDIL